MINVNAIDTETFLDRLRNITAQSHKNLENLPVSLSMVNPAVTVNEYAHYLNLMHDVVKDAEENIFPHLKDIMPDLEERRKSQLLENDLVTLGISKTNYKKNLSTSLPVSSTAFAMGIMYVTEGSTLGGRYILKNISEALGLDANKGAQYFAGYGNATGSKWKNFLNILIEFEDENNNEDEIIAGAVFAFDRISIHFTENPLQ
jgi:heme oxygenase